MQQVLEPVVGPEKSDDESISETSEFIPHVGGQKIKERRCTYILPWVSNVLLAGLSLYLFMTQRSEGVGCPSKAETDFG